MNWLSIGAANRYDDAKNVRFSTDQLPKSVFYLFEGMGINDQPAVYCHSVNEPGYTSPRISQDNAVVNRATAGDQKMTMNDYRKMAAAMDLRVRQLGAEQTQLANEAVNDPYSWCLFKNVQLRTGS
jgi:hypothetical protein